MNLVAASFKPWEVNWGQHHGDVVPIEIFSLIFQQLKPYQLLKAAQINKSWKLQIDQEWSALSLADDRNCFVGMIKKAELIWSRVNSRKGIDQLAEEKKKIEDAAARIKASFGFENNHFPRLIATYQNLFPNLKNLNLELANQIFHDSFGMAIGKVTQLYFKCVPNKFDFQIGSLNFIDRLPRDDLQEFVNICIEESRFEIVMAHPSSKISWDQKEKIHQYIIDLFAQPPEKISNLIFSHDFELVVQLFFQQAQQEIKDHPNSLYATKLKPIVDNVLKNANHFVKTGIEPRSEFDQFLLKRYGIKWLLGYDWKLSLYKFLFLDEVSRFCGLSIENYSYHPERFDLIYKIITAFPDNLSIQAEILLICDFYESVLRVKTRLEKSFYCPLSQKPLTQAVKTPDGNVFDLQTIVAELNTNSDRYPYTKKDLKPDFEKINQVYSTLIKIWETVVAEKRVEIFNTSPRLNAFMRFTPFAFNYMFFKDILEHGKQSNFAEVHRLCNHELDQHIKQNKHLSLAFVEGKISKEDYQVYQKYALLKNEIKEEYHYYLALCV